jgi:hypothetical protein
MTTPASIEPTPGRIAGPGREAIRISGQAPEPGRELGQAPGLELVRGLAEREPARVQALALARAQAPGLDRVLGVPETVPAARVELAAGGNDF